ncbi:hypothetical protein DYD21_01260 [Rhodohalobacter sp. SW132]|nr:hypothetical protein DYD21_01260 [Rhodohalobacter sp. SW132]
MSKGFTNVRHSAFDIQYSTFKTWIIIALIDLDPDIDSKRFRDCHSPDYKINGCWGLSPKHRR